MGTGVGQGLLDAETNMTYAAEYVPRQLDGGRQSGPRHLQLSARLPIQSEGDRSRGRSRPRIKLAQSTP